MTLLRDRAGLDLEYITKHVHGYFVFPTNDMLYSHSSRFLVLGHMQSDVRNVRQIFLYVKSSGNHWIEMAELLRDRFLHEMREAIDPVQHLPRETWAKDWTLTPELKRDYQVSFKTVAGESRYKQIRELGRTREAAIALGLGIRKRIEGDSKRYEPVLSWLDVGCEDGENTSLMLKEVRQVVPAVSLGSVLIS